MCQWPAGMRERVARLIRLTGSLLSSRSQTYFGPGPYYGWYGVDHDDKTSRPYIEKLSDPSNTFTYKVRRRQS